MGPFPINEDAGSLEVCVDSSMSYQQHDLDLDTGQKWTFDLDRQNEEADLDTGQHMTFNLDTGQSKSKDSNNVHRPKDFLRSLSKVKHQKCAKNVKICITESVLQHAKNVKANKNVQNHSKVPKNDKSDSGSAAAGKFEDMSNVKDNRLKTLHEEKTRGIRVGSSKDTRRSSKTEIILGGRQDIRIAKECRKLMKLKKEVMEEGSKVKYIDHGSGVMEGRKKEKLTGESQKIAQELAGEKLHRKNCISSQKDTQRAPAENEDLTVCMEYRGGEENSITGQEVEGGEDNSLAEHKSSLRISLCLDDKLDGEEKKDIGKEEKQDEEKKDEEKKDSEKEDNSGMEGKDEDEKEKERGEKLPTLVIQNNHPDKKDEEVLNQILKQYLDGYKHSKPAWGETLWRTKDLQNLILKEIPPLFAPRIFQKMCLPCHQVCPCLLTPELQEREYLVTEMKEQEEKKDHKVMNKEEEMERNMDEDTNEERGGEFGKDTMDMEGSKSEKGVEDVKQILTESEIELKKFQDILKSTEVVLERAMANLHDFKTGAKRHLLENDDFVNPGRTTLSIPEQLLKVKDPGNSKSYTGKESAHEKRQEDDLHTYNLPDRLLFSCTEKSNSIIPRERNYGRGDNSWITNPKDSNSGDKDYRSRRRYDRDASEKENRNQDDEKERDEQEDMSSNSNQMTMAAEQVPDFLVDENAVFKFRRKEIHGLLEETELMEFLGQLSDIDQDIPPDLLESMEGSFEEVNKCLITCLRKQTTEKEQDQCSTCLYLGSLIQHFGKCPMEYRAQVSLVCTMCLQLFRLVQLHVQQCVGNIEECPILMCRKISYLVISDKMMIYTKAAKIWRKLKKHMLSYVSVAVQTMEEEEEEYFSMTPLASIMQGMNAPPSRPSLRLSTVFNPNLPFIPEDQAGLSLNVQRTERPEIPKPLSKSEPIARKKPDGKVEILVGPSSASVVPPRHLPLRDLPDGKPLHPGRVISPSGSRLGVVGPPDGDFPILTLSGSVRQEKPPSKLPLKVTFSNELPKEKLHRKTSGSSSLPSPRLPSIPGGFPIHDVDLDAHPEQVSSAQPTEHEETEPLQPTSFSDYSETSSLGDKRTYGVGERIQSMPMNTAPWRNEQPLLSLEDRPTGYPGIGEVVYGQRDILQIVIRYWTSLKLEFKEFGRLLRRQVREEGVIFPDCKKKLLIMKSRYQKNFQWIRLTHLGRGMSGNCHLASDYNSDYQFCIKKIHISKYQEEELLIWSDLDHPSIVRLHGALRRKEKIYIISEFIGGGSLTETINNQKRMTRRLSHWMALNYFRQILKVLKYLQKKNVIHEDLKADNILLRSDSHKIAVGDFGVASRIHGNTVPPGMTTKGTPTQFSPEKAMSSGHSYKADLWSAVCVLVHMLSGDPPWIKRFPNAKMLYFIIVEKDPPLEDVPKNISVDVLDMIEQGFQKDPKMRPSAQELLTHRAFTLLESNPDTFTSTLLTSIHQLPDTQIPLKTPIQQEQHAMVEQIEREIRQAPGGATGKVFKSYESVTGKNDLNALSNVDVRAPEEPKIHVGKAQPEFQEMEAISKLSLQSVDSERQRFLSYQETGSLPWQKLSAINEKPFMSVRDQVGGAARSIDNMRLDGMRKAMSAKAYEFMPDKNQKYEFLNSYMEDNDDDIEVYTVMVSGGHSYPKLPPYETSSSDQGSSNGGAVGGETSDLKDRLPAFDKLIQDASETEDPEVYIDKYHDLAFQTQLSRTSMSSRSEEDVQRSVSRSSSQMYNDADQDYRQMVFNQDNVIETLMEEEHENQNQSQNHLLDSYDTQDASRSLASAGSDIRNQRSSDVRYSGGEASPSVNLPILTPFNEPSDEKTPEAIPQIGNLPGILDEFENSSTLSGRTGNMKSSELSEAEGLKKGSLGGGNDGKVSLSGPEEKNNENEKKDIKKDINGSPIGGERPLPGLMSDKQQSQHRLGEKSDHRADGSSHRGKILADSGPKTLPILLPSSKPDPVIVTQSPMSMFQEEESFNSGDLFASGPSSPNTSMQATSPGSYVPEISMAEHSPAGSSSSEMSFTKVQKFPDRKFEAFKPEEERPFTGEPSIHLVKEEKAINQSNKARNNDRVDVEQSNAGYQRRQLVKPLPLLDVNKSPKDKKKNRLSTPSFGVASPVTPQKYSTPQVGHKFSILTGVRKEDNSSADVTLGTPLSERQLHFPSSSSRRQDGLMYSTSPRSQSQLDENDMKIREFIDALSQHSNDSFIVHKDVDDPGVDISLYNEDNFEESLHYTLNQYIEDDEDEGKGKGLKVKIEVPNRESMEYRLTAEYYRHNWKQIIERDFSHGIHNEGMPVFTLYNGNTPLDLHNSPSDSGSIETLHLTAKDVRREKTQQQWYCEKGMCMNASGIPL